MTNAEKQEIIEAVLAALATNSKTIAQLSPKQSLIDSDLFEVAGGSRVTYQTLRSLIREGLALESQLSNYVTGDAAMMYLAKLDTETGTVDYKESPLVMLDGFKGVNGYTPVTGDLYYENLHGFQIWIKTAGGAENGIVANPNVAYVNKNDGAIYRWTGSSMVRIGGSAVINDLTTGGEGDALSAAMGKVIRQNIVAIYNALGPYAFPNGKPTLDWGGSTVIKHGISVSGVTGLTITDIEVGGVAAQSIPSQIDDGKSLIFKLTKTASQIYRGVSISMGGTDITENTGVWDETTGMVTIANVTGDIVVVASALTLVEYLQSDGNQWIDTGIVAGAGFKCEIKADVQAADTAWHRLLAARDADAKFAIAVGLRPTNESGCLYAQFGQAPNTGITFNLQQVTGLHTIITELTGTALSIKVDGVDGSVNQATSSLSFPDLSLYMFSNHRQDSTIESISAKVYYCKIWNGSDLLFDAIPVRVGQVGYMFDKVSGELLGNIGTGSFTLGNDK